MDGSPSKMPQKGQRLPRAKDSTKNKHGRSCIEKFLLVSIGICVSLGLFYSTQATSGKHALEDLNNYWQASFLGQTEETSINGKKRKDATNESDQRDLEIIRTKETETATTPANLNHHGIISMLQDELDKTTGSFFKPKTQASTENESATMPKETSEQEVHPPKQRVPQHLLERAKLANSKPNGPANVTAHSSKRPKTTEKISNQTNPGLPIEANASDPLPVVKDDAHAKETEKSNETPAQQSSGQRFSPKHEPLNIVLFYADDWTMNVLGKLDKNVATPNIDQMADNGLLFVNNCVTTSVCWISRATLMTGTYYSRHLQSTPSVDNLFSTHDWNQTLFPKLRTAGYYTGLIGKWHAPGPVKEMSMAFDVWNCYYGDHWMNTTEFSEDGSKEELHVTDVNLRHSLKFLKNRPKDKKFALKVSFFATHAVDERFPSYQPMNWSRFGCYPDDPNHANFTHINPPKTATEKHWNDNPYFFGDLTCGRLRRRNRWEPHVWQKNIRDLYAMATEVDWAVGTIINELKDQGVYNNTLLVFTTDNGDLHGEHGLAEKWFPFEESLKVPLVIQDPRMPAHKKGQFREEMTLNVDLAPTLLGAAGLQAPDFMQGRDIADLYLYDPPPQTSQLRRRLQTNHTATVEPWRKEWFYEWNMGDPVTAAGHAQENFIDASFALVGEEWKYIYWPQKNYEQLYHRSLDPYDEFDILQNFFIYQQKVADNSYLQEKEKRKMTNFTESTTTPLGDSIQSTKEIYDRLKARFQELKEHVQSGKPI